MGYEINVVFFTDGVSSRGKKNLIFKKNKRMNQAKIIAKNQDFNYKFNHFADNGLDNYPLLKIIKKIESYIAKFNPSIIFTHHEYDLNIDRQIISKAVTTATRPNNMSKIETILHFEIPCSTHQAFNNLNNFNPNWYEDISNFIENKVKMMSTYEDEIQNSSNPRSLKNIKYLSGFRGNTVGYEFAEAFMLKYKKN